VAENIHTKHILDFSIVPARVAPAVQMEAAELARNIADAFDLVGVLAVELFLEDSGCLVVNEMAPRTHNSGHWSLDGCITSQFEQQVRAVAGLPLGSTEMNVPAAVMVNILGDAWRWHGDGMVGTPNWAALLEEPRTKLHLYGKAEPRRGRKMGHFTVTGESVPTAFQQAKRLKHLLTD
jgi:5-(carboxyamino)imidazole ribonucleotide synthase